MEFKVGSVSDINSFFGFLIKLILVKNLDIPTFITNIEFGEDLYSGKIMYVRPNSAEKCRYLDQLIFEIKKLFIII